MKSLYQLFNALSFLFVCTAYVGQVFAEGKVFKGIILRKDCVPAVLKGIIAELKIAAPEGFFTHLISPDQTGKHFYEGGLSCSV